MDFQEYLEEQLKNPEFRKAYEELEPVYQVVRAITALRIEQEWTQEQYFDGIFQLHDEIRDYLAESEQEAKDAE